MFYKLASIAMCITSLGIATNAVAYSASHLNSSQIHSLSKTHKQPVVSAIYWETITGRSNRYDVPKNALVLGYNQAGALYACSTDYNGGTHPGQYTPKGCLITYGGKDIVQPDFKLLLGTTGHSAWYSQTTFKQMSYYSHDANWGFSAPGLSNQNDTAALPVIGGYEPYTDMGNVYNHYKQNKLAKLYICRGIIDNRIHLGKVISGFCNVAYQHKEYMLKSYQVLFYHKNFSTLPADSSPV